MARLVLTQDADGSGVSLHLGDTLELRLPENASTGYLWQVEQHPPCLVEQSGPPPADVLTPPGASSERTLVFGTEPGEGGVLGLALRRPWESGAAAVTLTVRVRVD